MKRSDYEKAEKITEKINKIDFALEVLCGSHTSHFEVIEHYGSNATTAELPKELNDILQEAITEYKQKLEIVFDEL